MEDLDDFLLFLVQIIKLRKSLLLDYIHMFTYKCDHIIKLFAFHKTEKIIKKLQLLFTVQTLAKSNEELGVRSILSKLEKSLTINEIS